MLQFSDALMEKMYGDEAVLNYIGMAHEAFLAGIRVLYLVFSIFARNFKRLFLIGLRMKFSKLINH